MVPFVNAMKFLLELTQIKKDAPAFDVEKLQQAIRSLTNEVVIILKRNNGEGTSNKGNFKTPYRPFKSSNARQNTPPDISTNEEVFNTIRVVYALLDTSTDQESDEDREPEQPETEEEDPKDPLSFNCHFWDSSAKEGESNDDFVFVNQHTHNTRSKGPVDSQPSSTPRNSP